jgi:hypothetical protein
LDAYYQGENLPVEGTSPKETTVSGIFSILCPTRIRVPAAKIAGNRDSKKKAEIVQ